MRRPSSWPSRAWPSQRCRRLWSRQDRAGAALPADRRVEQRPAAAQPQAHRRTGRPNLRAGPAGRAAAGAAARRLGRRAADRGRGRHAGKSTLVERLRQLAAGLKIATLIGAGDATEQSTPYHAWRSIFARTLICDMPARSMRASAICSAPMGSRLHHCSTPCLPLDLPENQLTSQLAGPRACRGDSRSAAAPAPARGRRCAAAADPRRCSLVRPASWGADAGGQPACARC